MPLTEDEKVQEHNRGQEDCANDESRNHGWIGLFESSEHYDERAEAYDKGYDNALEQEGKFDSHGP